MRELTPGPALDDPLEPYRRVDRAPVGDRPWVLGNMVAGLDGSAAVHGRVGTLSSETDQHLFRLLRSLADIVLVGAATVRQERYGPARLPEAVRAERVAAGRLPVPRIAVVTRSLDLDLDGRLFTEADPDAPPLVVTCESADDARRTEILAVAEVLVAGEQTVDLGEALRRLRRDGGAEVVLTEGGPALLGQLVHTGLLDELCLTLSPKMGGDALPVAVSTATSELVDLHLGHVLEEDGTLFLRYEREAVAGG
jgi:riboflavin biosynthesis pyrimidine reductase